MKMLRRIVISFLTVSCLLLPSVHARAEYATMTLINRSSQNLFRFYATPTFSGTWGADLLDWNGLQPGYQKTFYLPNGTCLYHLKVVTLSGVEINRPNQNICGFKWTIYD